MTTQASRMVKTVPVELDRTRHMRLTLGDALAFKEATTTEERPKGISLLRGDLASAELSEEEWLQLFLVCLKHEDPELTLEQLGDIVDMERFTLCGQAFEKLMAAFKGEEPAGPRRAGPTKPKR